MSNIDKRTCAYFDSNLKTDVCSFLRTQGLKGEQAKGKLKDSGYFVRDSKCPFSTIENWSICPLPKFFNKD